MKIIGITAEYNPFHNGHKYHIEKTRQVTGADYVIAVMSGNFTQRGEPAILDKWQRSKLAIENGVDLVVELPFVYACNRADNFAKGAVDILIALGATHISFGSESGEIDSLKELANALYYREAEIAEKRNLYMKQGNSYAKSNELAVEDVLGKEKAELSLEPNNILSLEYLKRMEYWKERGHNVDAVTVKRYGSGYFGVNEEKGFAGASHIRTLKTAEEVGRYVPKNVQELLVKALEGEDTNIQMFNAIKTLIVRSSAKELAEIYCVGEGLENKLKKEIVKADSMETFISSIVSKRYTRAAIRRMLVYMLLGIKDNEPCKGIYARILGANDKGKELLKNIKKQEESDIPLITNINKEGNLDEETNATLQYDILATDMYNLLVRRDLYEHSDRVQMPYMK